jgi:hypothetical protein
MSFLAAASVRAGPSVNVSVFAPSGPAGATAPDSITTGNGSVWVAWGNGADSTGASGSSTVVQYSESGSVLHMYSIPGLVDGLKFNPVTGMVWALQNNDGNSALSLINPATGKISALSYAVTSSTSGYDDVAFLNGKVYVSATNPANPTDSVLQVLNQGNNPSGPLTTTSILTAQQTNPAFTSSTLAPPDTDSLKSTPGGKLVLTSEGDGLGSAFASSDGRFTLISNPGTLAQTLTNVRVTNAMGVNVNGMDDVLFPGATAGTLYVTVTGSNKVYAIKLTGLDLSTPIVSLGSFNEVALVNPVTGAVGTVLLGGLTAAPHGMDFVPAPEPSVLALMLLGFAGLLTASARRRK